MILRLISMVCGEIPLVNNGVGPLINTMQPNPINMFSNAPPFNTTNINRRSNPNTNKIKFVNRIPNTGMKSSISVNPFTGQKKMSFTVPVPRHQTPMQAPYMPTNQPMMSPLQAPYYNMNSPPSNGATPQKYVLSPLYFPKNTPTVPPSYTYTMPDTLSDNYEPQDQLDDIELPIANTPLVNNTKPKAKRKNPRSTIPIYDPKVEIEPYSLEVSTPETDKEMSLDDPANRSKPIFIPKKVKNIPEFQSDDFINSRPRKTKNIPDYQNDDLLNNPPKKTRSQNDPDYQSDDLINNLLKKVKNIPDYQNDDLMNNPPKKVKNIHDYQSDDFIKTVSTTNTNDLDDFAVSLRKELASIRNMNRSISSSMNSPTHIPVKTVDTEEEAPRKRRRSKGRSDSSDSIAPEERRPTTTKSTRSPTKTARKTKKGPPEDSMEEMPDKTTLSGKRTPSDRTTVPDRTVVSGMRPSSSMPLDDVIKTLTKTKRMVTTRTATITEMHEESEENTRILPILTETSTQMPSKEEIEKETQEITRNVIPRLTGKKFLLKHNTDVISADKARRSYIDYKLNESKENQQKIEDKLFSLKRLEERLASKIATLTNERVLLSQKNNSTKNSVENNEGAIKALQEDHKRNEKLMKLQEMEINKLEKAISEERNKFILLSDQQKMYEGRLNSYGKTGNDRMTEMKIEESKLTEYDRLLSHVQHDFEGLKSKIQEVEKEKRREIDVQNRLEIERKDIEDSNHVPLFALYD